MLAVAVPDGLLALRPARAVLATGAYERGLPLPDGDRPGVLLAGGAQRLLVRDGVLPGRHIAVVTDEPYGHSVAALLRSAGAAVSLVDARPDEAAGADVVDAALPLLARHRALAVHGRRAVTGLSVLGPRGCARLRCDTVAIATGRRPADELLLQRSYAGSVLLEAGSVPPDVAVVGGAAGAP